VSQAGAEPKMVARVWEVMVLGREMLINYYYLCSL